jgi:phage terminase small subunit
MPSIDINKQEQFAQLIAKGVSVTKAYVTVGYSPRGAAQGGARLLRNVQVCARVRAIRERVSAATIAVEISSRNARIQALQTRWEKMRQVIEERGASEEYSSVPGGTTGLLTKDYKGKQADTPVYKVDTALLAELRAHERQAAEELCQWKAVIEDRKTTIDATPAAIALAMILSTTELEALAAKLKAAREAAEVPA